MTYKLILGNKNYSSWSLRGWLAMKQSGAACEEIVLNLYGDDIDKQKASYTQAGRVPVLLDGDLTVWDSLAIAEYLAERHPDAGLWPKDAPKRAYARSLCAEMHSGFMALREHWPMNVRARSDRKATAAVEKDVARIQEAWAQVRSVHGADGPFLFGSWCLADAFFAPVVSRFVTYGPELSADSLDYVQAVMEKGWVQEWCVAAAAEPWSFPKYDV